MFQLSIAFTQSVSGLLRSPWCPTPSARLCTPGPASPSCLRCYVLGGRRAGWMPARGTVVDLWSVRRNLRTVGQTLQCKVGHLEPHLFYMKDSSIRNRNIMISSSYSQTTSCWLELSAGAWVVDTRNCPESSPASSTTSPG